MASPKRSIIPMIDINYKNFSPAEKKIADFFINNELDDIDLSAKAITQRLYVSEATLSRFAKKSGFKGYRELVFAYKNQEKKKVISWILQEKRKRLSGQGRRKPALTIK